MKFLRPFLILTLCLMDHSAYADSDPQAEKLLAQVRNTYKTLKSLTATVVWANGSEGSSAPVKDTLKMKKPNYIRMETVDLDAYSIFSDGKTSWMYNKQSNSGFKTQVDQDGGNIFTGTVLTQIFFVPEKAFVLPESLSQTARYLGKREFQGQQYQVVELERQKPFFQKEDLYIGADMLIHRSMIVSQRKNGKMVNIDVYLKNLRPNVSIPLAEFAVHVPAEAKIGN